MAHQKTDTLGALLPDVPPPNLSPKESVVRGSEAMCLHLSVGTLGMQIIWLPLWQSGAYNYKCIMTAMSGARLRASGSLGDEKTL